MESIALLAGVAGTRYRTLESMLALWSDTRLRHQLGNGQVQGCGDLLNVD